MTGSAAEPVDGWVITVGDELLNGVRVDTNTAWLADRLASIGVKVVRAISVRDRQEDIRAVVAESLANADVVIVSGGLGPTEDDVTRQAIADLFDADLLRSSEVEAAVRSFFEDRGRTVSEVNLDQALVPEGFEYAVNPRGTAPGLMKRLDGRFLFILPGVPGEMKALYESWVEPVLREAHGDRPGVRRKWFRTTGIGESDLSDRIGRLDDLSPFVSVGYLPSAFGTAIYLTGSSSGGKEEDRCFAAAEERIRKGAGDYLFADSDQELPEHIADLLTTSGQTLATAESCTGGLIAGSLTDVPGASTWFLRGWVVYSNQSKEEELRVPHDLLLEHGAVSAEVARAMAEGARDAAASDYALSVTGIAGPTGGTEDKPVGLTFIGCSGPDGTVVREYHLGTMGRRYNKQRSMVNALDLLRRLITGLDPMAGGWETPG